MARIGILLLAAGASTRLGTPKQSLRYAGQTLLHRAAGTAVASGCRPILVVLGACVQPLQPELEGLPVRSVENTGWAEGMGSSLRAGMEALLAEAGETLEAVLIMLCDQPLVTAQTLHTLIRAYQETGRPLIAAEYEGVLGVPALFHRSLFSELAALQGAEGARKLIQRHRDQALGVPLPEASVDIDTLEDYARLCEDASL
ncbi:MAG TPA: nucleotidyltransferase family protein [Chthonomonadaceae bacterium]|nr:nucleotidyltransferase family protein [Chthonomonadaceae bacterium]